MRITEQIMLQGALREIRAMREALASTTEAVVSGKRIRTASDDPSSAHRLMRVEHYLRVTEQFQRNSAIVRTRLEVEEQVITTVSDLVASVTGQALGVTSDLPTDPVRQAVLQEATLALESIIAFGNTEVAGEFIFGGNQTAAPPFLANGTYVGDSTVRQVEIDDGLLVQTNHAGGQLLGSTIQALQDLIVELQTGTGASIQAAAVNMDPARQDLATSQAETGARLGHLEAIDRALLSKTNVASADRDGIQAVDSSEALLKVLSAQQAIERAYAALGRVLNTSLLDHLP